MAYASAFKKFVGLLIVILSRLIPHPPNVEPVMATVLPYAKKYGALYAAGFALLANASFDFISGRVGLWTIYTSILYAGVGYVGAKYLQNKPFNARTLVPYAVVSTLAFDFVTALLFGWQFNQPLFVTLAGQVPFTLNHLLGNVLLTAIVSPLIYKYVVENPSLEVKPLPSAMRF